MKKNIEIPSLKVQTKVKSIQVFRKPVDKAFQGDRCGICISNFDSKQFERGVVSSPNYVRTCYGVIINLEKVKYFKGTISSGSKFHISIGHETLLGKIIVFAEPDGKTSISSKNEFDFNREYIYLDEFNSDVDNHKKDVKFNIFLLFLYKFNKIISNKKILKFRTIKKIFKRKIH